MFFPIAGIEISPWIPLAAAFAISLCTSMAGVSGAFLLLPFQMSFLGFGSPAASATNHLFNVIATPAGVWQYHREQRMMWPLTGIIAMGHLPGVVAGALLRIHYLADMADFQVFAGLVLAYLGGKLAFDLFRDGERRQQAAECEFRKTVANDHAAGNAGRVMLRRFDLRQLDYEFCGQAFSLSVPRLTCLSLAVGIVGGAYGIGGGAFIAPFLVTFFRIPVYVAAGAALLATFLTSAAGVVFYYSLAGLYPHLAVAPDWMLGTLFGVGGMAGMYTGARLQKFMSARLIKGILAVCIFIPAIGYLRTPFRRAA